MELMDISALSRFLGVHTSWIYEHTRPTAQNMIPHFKVGKYLRFDPEAVKAWLASLERNNNNSRREKERESLEEKTMTRSTYQKGSVVSRKRKNKTIYVLRYRLRDSDRWINKTEELKGSKSEREARRAADSRMVEINAINNGKVPVMTVERFAQSLWKDFLETKKLSTRYMYEHNFQKHIQPELGNRNVHEVSPVDIKNLLNKISKTVEKSSLLVIYTQLRGFFSLIAEYGLISLSPVKPKLHRPKVARREKPVITAEQIHKVFAQFSPDQYLLFAIMSIYLLRIGEVLGLRWMNFNHEAKTLSIESTLWFGRLQPPKTEGSKKTFQMPEVLAEALQQHKEQSAYSKPSDFVFCTGEGKYLSEYVLRKRVWYPALAAAGIERRKSQTGFHLLRHSGATLLYAITKDLKLVQIHARHSKISTTSDLYIHAEGLTGELPSEILTQALFRGLTVAGIAGKPN
jgi:integrase